MAKGLKQMVADALGHTTHKPVNISGEATAALARLARQWSGVPDAKFRLGVPAYGSPWASWESTNREFTLNVDELLLNPHRVLFTITPFRLKQEAILTGTLLHEAGHARFSKWRPDGVCVPHSDGTTATAATIDLASTLEEARIEGFMAKMSTAFGADGLDWTMRAAAAHLLPVTDMSRDPNQALMDFITSWALRAGRQHALIAHGAIDNEARWVGDFDKALIEVMENHLLSVGESDPHRVSRRVYDLLYNMLTCIDNTGPSMIDSARDVLTTLFPETPPEEMPQAGGGCSATPAQAQGEDDGATRSTENTDEDTESEDGEGSDEDTESDSDGEDSDDESEGDGDGDPEDSDDDTESEGGSGDSDDGDPEEEDESPLASVLSALEQAADDAEQDEADEEMESANGTAGAGAPSEEDTSKWRTPTKVEREIAGGAERFLRQLIAPAESSRTSLTEAPSATIDPAAHAAWKAGGMVRDPRFFKRTSRIVEPSPPVKIVVLVDVSGSMDQLQRPSAVLSWALSSAALDLRNFAGRGVQVESCLIHWGDSARVIQRNGETLPGIREYLCVEGTSAMHKACEAAQEQIPGFFDLPADGRPENRLLVQFTDWELNNVRLATPWIARALEAGVNMLSVVPGDYREHGFGAWSALPEIKKACTVQRGTMSLLKYDWRRPSEVWEHAARTLINV